MSAATQLTRMKTSRTTKISASTLLKCAIGGLLVLLTADLQAQLLYKTKFLPVEGYTSGWLIGQPSTGNPATGNIWSNINAFFDLASSMTGECNNGHSYTNADGSPWYIHTITNISPTDYALCVRSDNNLGTNTKTYFVKMGFPTTRRGPITVTWDWQFCATNPIPADYDEYTNNYNSSLSGYDHGFCTADYENRWLGYPATADPNWVYAANCTPVRISGVQDCRYNGQGVCGGGGNWPGYGPEFKDGKLLHMTTICYLTNAAPTNFYDIFNTYDNFCQRDEPLPSGTNWQTAFCTPADFFDAYSGIEHVFSSAWGMRECPGRFDPTSGINCITLWMNGSQTRPGYGDDKNPASYYWSYVLIRNIRVVGPDPIPHPHVNITGGTVTFDAGSWLEAADSLHGPWTTVSIQAPYLIPAGSAMKFYRAVF